MKYEINYGLFPKEERHYRAMLNIISYLSDSFDKVFSHTLEAILSYEPQRRIIFSLSFAGLNGFVAWAMIDECHDTINQTS